MIRWWRQGGGNTWFLATFSVAMSLLLVNAVAIAPIGHLHDHHADHCHESDSEENLPHDSSRCLICLLIATGVWTPSASPPFPTVAPAFAEVMLAAVAPAQADAAQLPLVRGPPATA